MPIYPSPILKKYLLYILFYYLLLIFTYYIIKLFSHIPGIIEGYSLWINSYTNNYGICIKCYIEMARSKSECSDLKGIVRDIYEYI